MVSTCRWQAIPRTSAERTSGVSLVRMSPPLHALTSNGGAASLDLALRNDLPIPHARLLVRALRRLALAVPDGAHLLRPTLVYRPETPLGAPARRPDRPAVDEH